MATASCLPLGANKATELKAVAPEVAAAPTIAGVGAGADAAVAAVAADLTARPEAVTTPNEPAAIG